MFGGFKASLNILTGKRSSNKYYEIPPDTYVNGAYKTNYDDFFVTQNQPQRTVEDAIPHLRPKSTTDLTNPKPIIPNLRNSVPEISTDPRGAEQSTKPQTKLEKSKKSDREAKKAEKEAKKLEKQRLAEQKERDRLAALEQAKLKKNKTKNGGKNVKKQAPQPDVKQKANPLAQRPYSTNTLESSISKTSGPPPYEIAQREQSKDNPGVSFSKPIDEGSWDLINKHRQQINRPIVTKMEKKTVLQYDTGYNDVDNSEV